jgi:ABC-type transport system substrate-binding protein
VNVRKAVNFALDRRAINRQGGLYGGAATDQILPRTMPGYRAASIYPLDGPDLETARRLMRGAKLNATLWTYPGAPEATLIRENLKPIGIDVEIKQPPFEVLASQITNPKTDYDMVLISWGTDYPDPYALLNLLLSGSRIQPKGNTNLALFDDTVFDGRLASAARLSGQERYSTYGQIDVDIMRTAAPWAPLADPNNRELVSKRVGCYVAPGTYGALDLAAVCLK